MDIGFFVEYKNRIVQLPVNPEKVEVSYPGNNSTVEVINLGEINLIKGRKLAKISFSSFFPESNWFPAVRTKNVFEGPKFYKDFFTGIQNDEKPCRLVITGIDITMRCSIESFQFYHQGGDHEDAYYSLELKEYKDSQIIQVAIDKSLNRPVAQAAAPALPLKATEITVGCNVILNGQVHYDSYGSKPGKAFSNYKGKVNLINKAGSHPYHVTTPTGGWLGWVTAGSVTLA